MTSLNKQLEDLISERNSFEKEAVALKAQAEEFRNELDYINSFIAENSSYELFKKLLDWGKRTDLLLLKTPEQCLNSVKADAIDEFWVSMLLECLGSDNGVDAVLDCYTNDNLLTPVKEYYVGKLRVDNARAI